MYYTHPDKKYKYKELHVTDKFQLIQVNGSISSVKTYNTKEEAINDGWRELNETDEKILQ